MDFPQKPLMAAPTKIRWVVFALAFLSSWTLYLHRYVFGLIKPKLAEEWGLESDELGLMDSVFSLTYSGFQFPLGIAADVLGVRLILTLLTLLGAIGLALHAWAPSPSQLWFARGFFGTGQSAIFANLNRIAPFWFPKNIRTTLQGAVGVTAGRLGGLSTSLLFGYLLLGVLELDWRTATFIFAGFGVLLAALTWLFFRNTPQTHPLVNQAEVALIEGDGSALEESASLQGPTMTTREMLRRMSPRSLINFFALNVQSILSTIADNIYSAWIPLFLFEVHNLKFKEMGIYWSLPLLGGALAGLIGGVLNDRCIALTNNRRWSRTAVAMIGKGMAAALLFVAMFWYQQPYAFCIFLFFVKLFGDWSLTTSWGVVTDIGGKATASVFAFNNTVAGIGAILAPILYGFLALHYGWRAVFLSAAVTYVFCAISWLFINCTVPLLASEEIPEE